MVLLFHARVSLDYYVSGVGGYDFLIGRSAWDYFGKTGVDIFFVISGFVISISFLKLDLSRVSSIRTFVIRRLIRIAPPFWIVMAVYALYLSATGREAVLTWQNVTANALFLPYMNHRGALETILPVSWTLNYEMMFYMVLAAFSVLAGRFAAVCTAVLFSLFALLFYTWGSDLNAIQKFVFNPHSLEFVFGVGIGVAYVKGFCVGTKQALILLLLGFFVLIRVGFHGYGDGYIGRVIYAGLPAAVIVIGSAWLAVELPGKIKRTFMLLGLGDASYSIYLVHILAFNLLVLLLGGMSVTVNSWGDVAVLYTGMVVVGVISGIAFHRYVESPVTQRLNQVYASQTGGKRPAPVGMQSGGEG